MTYNVFSGTNPTQSVAQVSMQNLSYLVTVRAWP